jgi:hypothetical protein
MAEALTIIFKNFWTFSGTLVIILTIGHALSLPFYWHYKMKQNKMNKSIWHHHQ